MLEGEKAGLWTDRAENSGGDVFALIGGHYRIDVQGDFPRVLERTAELLGPGPHGVPARKARRRPPVDELGPATAKWDYQDAAGNLIAVVYRYDPPGRQEGVPALGCQAPQDGAARPPPALQPAGAGRLPTQVVLVEGEKCAQALIEAGFAATTAMHGANAPVEKTDWSPLAGKAVLIWPDRDKPGYGYAEAASQAVLPAGAVSCAILSPPDDRPEGWDAADALAEGFDVAGFLAERSALHRSAAGRSRASGG